MKLTVIIICRSRREAGIEKSIKSAEFADEVLVIEHQLISNYAQVRNEALMKAKGDWILFLDADEEITSALAEEIQKRSLLKGDSLNGIKGFYARRRDLFLGGWLKHGETANVRLLRLARKDAGKWVRPVHEVWKINGKTGELKNPLLHYSHQSTVEMLDKIDKYSELEANYRLGKLGRFGKFGRLGQMAIFPVGKFLVNYFLRLGFLDGIPGFIHAVMMSWHSFLVRAKLISRMSQRISTNNANKLIIK